MDQSEISHQSWDVLIIGAGMGGSAAAYKLTAEGHRVLILEKGLSAFPKGTAESAVKTEEDYNSRLLEGRWPEQLSATIDGHSMTMWPALGCGTGGSTLIYAAALERFSREDFEGVRNNIFDTSWPYSYDELEPHYLQAERLFHVAGTQDPLEPLNKYSLVPPRPMNSSDSNLFDEFTEAGLSPYRLHVGARFLPGCNECGGHVCQRECKSDANNCCLKPAMATGNLTILCEVDVIDVQADKNSIISVRARHQGLEQTFTAKYFILAAGALFTPIILQRSRSTYWPDGIGNQSDMLGRNLMFHASDFIAIWPRKQNPSQPPSKAIAFRDLYRQQGNNLGQIQSMGLNAGYGNILHFMSNIYDRSWLRHFPLLKHLLKIPAYLGARIFKEATVFASIVEDFPYRENRVIVDNDSHSGMRFYYNRKPELIERVRLMRKLLKVKLNKHRIMIVNHEVALNYGHPCGTCRAGQNPTNSVVDRNCRIHGIDNGYVADASFMPSSGGTNPSLTIAANALRVADIISRRLKNTSSPE